MHSELDVPLGDVLFSFSDQRPQLNFEGSIALRVLREGLLFSDLRRAWAILRVHRVHDGMKAFGAVATLAIRTLRIPVSNQEDVSNVRRKLSAFI